MPKQRIGDVELYYEIVGAGEPLVLIHGLGSSTQDWEWQVPTFSERYKVITADMRGHGQSDKPPGPYSVPQFAADTAGLLRHLDSSPAHVVGISMGGMIGLQLAVDAPELVRSLTVVNSGVELIARTFKEKLAVWQRFALVRLVGMRRMGEFLAGRLFPRPEEDGLRATFVQRWAENDQRAYLDAMRALVGWSVSERLGEIRCPTLVIASDQDYTPVAEKEAYVARIAQAQLVVIEDAHHAVTAERPEAFNRALAEFLDSLA